jgi:glycosyltransferase involved in cell wall biosynthesis
VRLVTVHDLSVFRYPETHTERTVEVQTRLLRQCASEADALVAVSQNCKDELIDLLNVPAEHIHVVPNGVDLAEFQGDLDSGALDALKKRLGVTRDYFIQLGTIEPRKNIPRLLEAYNRLLKQRHDVPQLVFVGKPGWKSEQSFRPMRPLVDGNYVVYGGYVAREEAVLLLRGARACIYPSLYEGFGLPVLEAMAARTPVITSNVSSLPEVAAGAALFVDPTTPEAITSAMAEILDDPDTAAIRVRRGYKRACSLTWDASAAALAQLYRSLAPR